MLLVFIISERGIEANLEKNLGHHEDGLDTEDKGGTADHRVPRRTQPLHLMPQ
jgi:hypothetical protein